MSDIGNFKLQHGDFTPIGHDLARPECVLPTADGALWVSDQRSALIRIDADGTQQRFGSIGGLPNGFALGPDGRFWIAEIELGRLVRMDAHGRHEVMLDRFDGAPLGSANFVLADARERLWLTVSTRVVPRADALRHAIADGYLLRLDPPYDRPVKAAGGFCFTNECRIDAARGVMYVAETALGGVLRLPLRDDGTLGAAEPFGPRPLFPGAHVDGITLDAEGNLWVTEIKRHGLWVIRPDGTAHAVFEDPDGRTLLLPTSLAFAGADRRTAIVGSLKADRLMSFRAPVPGAPAPHEHWRPA